MIPVEDAAGGAAAVLHDQPERTPDQHADQIAHIERNGDHEEDHVIDDSIVVQQADGNDQGGPEDEYLIGGLGGGDHIVTQGLIIDFVPDGAKAV